VEDFTVAVYDIMPHSSPWGGAFITRWAQMTASEVFDIGEPVMVVAAGTLTEPTDDAAQWTLAQMADGNLCGIAAAGPAGGAQTNDRAAQINPATGIAYTTGDDIPYWPVDMGIVFRTQNLYAAAAGSAVTPAITDIGNSYQVTYGTFGTPDAGWGLEQTSGVFGTDVCAQVVDVLDSLYRPIRLSGQTGVHVLFTLTAGAGS
jgi:hypothetical protein